MTKKPNKQDLRYIKTEKALRKALFCTSWQGHEHLAAKRLCEMAHIAPSTFYMHYHSANDLLKLIEAEILLNYSSLIDKIKTFNPNDTEIIEATLWFLFLYKRYFRFMAKIGDFYLLAQIAMKLVENLRLATKEFYYDLLKSIVEWIVEQRMCRKFLPTYSCILIAKVKKLRQEQVHA